MWSRSIPRTEPPAAPTLRDPAVPGLEVLLGSGAAPLLAEIAAERGAELGPTITRRQVRYRPGRSVIVEFVVDLSDSGGSRRQILTVAGGLRDAPPSSHGHFDGVSYAWWWFPHDPYLPGLSVLADRDVLADVLAQLGVADPISFVRTRAYRASRRAVVEVHAGSRRVFLKIVDPERARELHDLHRELIDDLPVPPSHGVAAAQGIVVLGAVAGVPLRGEVRDGRWDDWSAVADLADRFGSLDPTGRRAVSPPTRRLKTFRSLFEVIAPAGVEVVDALRADPALTPRTEVTVHGDFHTGQLLIDATRPAPLGLVDLDTVGVGDPIVDRAAMLGQLAVLASTDGHYQAGLEAAYEVLGRVDEPHRLNTWTAAHVAGLATGPFRAQDTEWMASTRARLELARRIHTSGVLAGPS